MRLSPHLPYISAAFPYILFNARSTLSSSVECSVSSVSPCVCLAYATTASSSCVFLGLTSLKGMEVGKGAVSSEEEGQIMDDEEENREKPEEK